MAHDAVRNSTLTRTVADVFGDLADLLHKEVRLAGAELTDNVTSGVQASIWMIVAAVLTMMAILFVLEAVVFGLASFGLALHWGCLIVAAFLATWAGGAFAYGRSAVPNELLPTRSIRQLNEDIHTAKEQLT